MTARTRSRIPRGKQATCALCGKRILVRGPSWFTQRTEGGLYQVIHWDCFYGRPVAAGRVRERDSGGEPGQR